VISPEQIKKIREIIEKHFNTFIIQNLGADILSSETIQKLKDRGLLDKILPGLDLFTTAYTVGKRRGTLPMIPNKQDLDSLKLIGLTDQDLKSLEYIRTSAGHYIKNLESTVSNQVITKIMDANKERNFTMVGDIVKPVFERAIEESHSIYQITRNLRELTGDMVRDWKRVSITTMNDAYNQGAVNEIVSRNKDKGKDDTLVYMNVVRDENTCSHCLENYLEPSGKPRVFRLSELLANGTNVGRKAANWLPTVPPQHVNCRCRLVELLDGWTLNEIGQQVYVNPNFHYFNNPNK
jgi:hypothetical protein